MVLAEFLLDQLHRREDRPLRAAGAEAGRADRHGLGKLGIVEPGGVVRRAGAVGSKYSGACSRRKARDAVEHDLAGIFAGHRQKPLPTSLVVPPALWSIAPKACSMIVGLAFLDDEHRVLVFAEVEELVVDQRIGDVQDIERHFGVAIDVGKAEALQRADDAVIHAALQDDADAALRRARRTR